MTALATAEFFGTAVSILDHQRRRWLTARDVGLCLGYAPEKASTSISNLYKRHEDDFTDEDTCSIKLMEQVQSREVRIFSASGCVTLAWLSATPKAKEFKRWAKDNLAAQMNGELVALSLDEVNTLVDASRPGADGAEARRKAKEVFSRFSPNGAPVPAGRLPAPKVTRALELDVLTRFAGGATLSEIAQATGVSKATASMISHGRYRFVPGAGEDLTTPELLRAVTQRHIARDMERLAQKYCSSLANRRLESELDEAGNRFVSRWQALEG